MEIFKGEIGAKRYFGGTAYFVSRTYNTNLVVDFCGSLHRKLPAEIMN